MTRENPEPKPEVDGHTPIEYREGNFWLGERLVKPDFEIGPEEYHRRLFIEYERTFGRGIAKGMTHHPTPGIDRNRENLYGRGFQSEYFKLQKCIPMMCLGTPEEVEELIEELRWYRNRHPALYSDVKEHELTMKWKDIK